MIMISAIGRSPAMAAPIAVPRIAASEIGVSTTRRSPNCVVRPSVIWKTPPNGSWMSSPSRNTRSSRSISSRIASVIASFRLIWRVACAISVISAP